MNPSQSENVRVVDTCDNLKLYHYFDCNNSSPKTVKQSRGTIVNTTTGKVVMQSFPYTEEIVWGNDTQLPFIGKRNIYFPSFEGTIIRVFFDGVSWHVSTHKRINAFTSRWGGPASFGDLFRQAVEATTGKSYNDFFSLLNTNVQYVFLLLATPQTRIVSPASQTPTVFLVSSVVDGKMVFDHKIDSVYTPQPVVFDQNIGEYENVFNFMQRFNTMNNVQGFFVVSEDDDGNRNFYKLITPHYNSLQSLRGNTFDIGMRYLEIRTTDKIVPFTHLYPEHLNTFMFIESQLGRIVHTITRSYHARYNLGKYARVHRMLYPFMKKVHEYVLHNGSPPANRMTMTMAVWTCLVNQPKQYVMKMIYADF